MKLPLQIVFRNMDPSAAIEAKIRERVAKLEQYARDVMSCRVVVEPAHKHHHKGRLYRVHIDLRLPGAEIVAAHESAQDHAHEDVYVAIRDAFDAVRRRLEDQARRRRGQVKRHEHQPHGRIVELPVGQDHGRIEADDGHLVYFHRNSLVDAEFDRLRTGMEVRFVEEAGEYGPQASTVHVLGGHRA